MGASGRTLAYDIHGEGTPVVFLHGLTFNRAMWLPIMQRLGDGVQGIAFDLPGHGASGSEPASVREAAAAVGHTLDALEIHEPFVVGHSIAAVIALHIAAARPVRGVVDVDQPLNAAGFVELLHRIEPTLRDVDFRTAWAPFERNLGLDKLDTATRADIVSTQRIDRELVFGYWGELFTTSPADAEAGNARLLEALDAPFLGAFGRTLSEPERSFIVDHLRGEVELAEYPGEGHAFHLVDAGRFTTRLLAFVNGPAPAA